MNKGKLIAIEGIDGVGKNTQAQLLRDYIVKEKGACGFFSFPRYETATGKKVGSYLRGELGDLNILERADLYSQDRKAAHRELNDYLDNGIDVVCDRYVLSNIIYFRAVALNEGMTEGQIQEILQKIEDKEFVVNNLPRPDGLIILTLPTEMSRQLVLNKSTRNYTDEKLDLHEKQTNIQLLAYQGYNLLNFLNHQIQCNNGDVILTIDEIHQLVVEKYKNQIRG